MRILNAFADRVYLGRDCWGIDAASQTLFNTRPQDLTVDQAAVLASLPKLPGYCLKYPHRLKDRAKMIPSFLVEAGVITKDQATAAQLPDIPKTATCKAQP